MTDDEAGLEAIRRWGDKAITLKTEAPLFQGGWLYKVGKRTTLPHGDEYVSIRGLAQSWEEAFAFATRYEHRMSYGKN
jgi:hypothetical protein